MFIGYPSIEWCLDGAWWTLSFGTTVVRNGAFHTSFQRVRTHRIYLRRDGIKFESFLRHSVRRYSPRRRARTARNKQHHNSCNRSLIVSRTHVSVTMRSSYLQYSFAANFSREITVWCTRFIRFIRLTLGNAAPRSDLAAELVYVYYTRSSIDIIIKYTIIGLSWYGTHRNVVWNTLNFNRNLLNCFLGHMPTNNLCRKTFNTLISHVFAMLMSKTLLNKNVYEKRKKKISQTRCVALILFYVVPLISPNPMDRYVSILFNKCFLIVETITCIMRRLGYYYEYSILITF